MIQRRVLGLGTKYGIIHATDIELISTDTTVNIG